MFKNSKPRYMNEFEEKALDQFNKDLLNSFAKTKKDITLNLCGRS